MGVIALEELEAGLVLSADVHDVNGRLLLGRGQVLRANHLRILKIWGVAEVAVSGGTVAGGNHTGGNHAGGDLTGGDSAGGDGATGAEMALNPEALAAAEATLAAMFGQLDPAHTAIAFVRECAISIRCAQGRAAPIHTAGKSIAPGAVGIGLREIQAKIDRDGVKLPEAPTIVLKLNQVLADPQTSADDVAQIVGTSPSLTALILRIVNSAAFGLPTRVDRISRAVALLGTREISALAMGVSVMKAFMDIPRGLMDMNAFLSHSLACATITRYLAALANHRQTEQLFIAGLLHDIGKLVLLKYFPQEMGILMQAAWDKAYQGPFYAVEKAAIGKSHAQIAGLLLKKWQFPIPLTDLILHHHTPSRSLRPSEAVLVQMADLVVNAAGMGSSGERVIPNFDAVAWETAGIARSSLKTAIRQGEQQLRAMEAILSVEDLG